MHIMSVYSHELEFTSCLDSDHILIHIWYDSHHISRIHIISWFTSCVWRHTWSEFTWYVYSHHMCHVTHPYVWYDAKQTHMGLFAMTRRVPWLIPTCDMTPSYHMCHVTHPYVCHDAKQSHLGLFDTKSFVCVTYNMCTQNRLSRQKSLGLHGEKAYGVPTTSRLLQIIGLCCKRALWKGLFSAKET